MDRFFMKNAFALSNKYIFFNNPYLSKKYNVHINDEICTRIKLCKYFYKYVYNGPNITFIVMKLDTKMLLYCEKF